MNQVTNLLNASKLQSKDKMRDNDYKFSIQSIKKLPNSTTNGTSTMRLCMCPFYQSYGTQRTKNKKNKNTSLNSSVGYKETIKFLVFEFENTLTTKHSPTEYLCVQEEKSTLPSKGGRNKTLSMAISQPIELKQLLFSPYPIISIVKMYFFIRQTDRQADLNRCQISKQSLRTCLGYSQNPVDNFKNILTKTCHLRLSNLFTSKIIFFKEIQCVYQTNLE